jgi:hypothetical protein
MLELRMQECKMQNEFLNLQRQIISQFRYLITHQLTNSPTKKPFPDKFSGNGFFIETVIPVYGKISPW